jgi:hypothetical protein
MNGVSINDLTEDWRRKPTVQEMAYSEPDVSGIAPHVFEAHNQAKARLPQHGTASASITFRDEIGAFELVAENRDVMAILRSLGPEAKITIHF